VAKATDNASREGRLPRAEITLQKNNPIAFSDLGNPSTKVSHGFFTHQVQG
jgi:hypothetical protein